MPALFFLVGFLFLLKENILKNTLTIQVRCLPICLAVCQRSCCEQQNSKTLYAITYKMHGSAGTQAQYCGTV